MTRRGAYGGWDDNGQLLPGILFDQWEGNWRGTDAVDMTGRPIEPGMWLVKTYQSGRSCNLEIRKVHEVRRVTTKDWGGNRVVSEPRVFLDTSKVPVQYPGRCLIVDWDPSAERLAHVADPER